MKHGVPSHINRENLILISKIAQGIEHFIFFGTLLGVVRNGNPIDGDDDIDILVNHEHRSVLVDCLEGHGLKIDFSSPTNQTPYFLQVKRELQGFDTTIDFYFFETTGNHITERWNFNCSPEDPRQALKIPKSLIYPIKDHHFFGSLIRMPNEPQKLCEWLYGSNWATPRKKREEYVVKIIHNKPMLVRPLKRSLQRWVPKFMRDTVDKILIKIHPI